VPSLPLLPPPVAAPQVPPVPVLPPSTATPLPPTVPMVVAARPVAQAPLGARGGRRLGRSVLAVVAVVAGVAACGFGGSSLVRSRVEVDTTAAAEGGPAHDAPALVLPTTPPTTTAPQGEIDLGHGISYTLPTGTLANTAPNGMVFAGNTTELVVRVSVRPPGEDPAVALQEYTNEVDLGADSVSYSPAFPLLRGSTRNGYWVAYAAVREDGSVHRGYIEVIRRSDGLTLLTDQHAPLNVDFDAVFDDAYEAFDSELASAGAVAQGVPLPRPEVKAVATIHSTMSFAGLVSLSAPSGWTTNEPGPERVAATGPDGDAIVFARLAPGAGQPGDAMQGLLATVVGNVSLAEPTASSPDDTLFEAEFDATDASGAPVRGWAFVWTAVDGTPTAAAVTWSPYGAADGRVGGMLFVLEMSADYLP